jgi:hypothetical protein
MGTASGKIMHRERIHVTVKMSVLWDRDGEENAEAAEAAEVSQR